MEMSYVAKKGLIHQSKVKTGKLVEEVEELLKNKFPNSLDFIWEKLATEGTELQL